MSALSTSLNGWLETEALRLTPPNKFWYAQRWIDTSKVFWRVLVLVSLVSSAIAFFWLPGLLGIPRDPIDYIVYAMCTCVFGVVPVFMVAFVPLIVIIVSERGPADWQRYSVADFADKWDIVVPPLTKKIQEIRSEHLEAEFYVLVFQKKPAVDTFDYLLLVERFDELGNVYTFQKGGRPVLLIDGQFRELPPPALA